MRPENIRPELKNTVFFHTNTPNYIELIVRFHFDTVLLLLAFSPKISIAKHWLMAVRNLTYSILTDTEEKWKNRIKLFGFFVSCLFNIFRRFPLSVVVHLISLAVGKWASAENSSYMCVIVCEYCARAIFSMRDSVGRCPRFYCTAVHLILNRPQKITLPIFSPSLSLSGVLGKRRQKFPR